MQTDDIFRFNGEILVRGTLTFKRWFTIVLSLRLFFQRLMWRFIGYGTSRCHPPEYKCFFLWNIWCIFWNGTSKVLDIKCNAQIFMNPKLSFSLFFLNFPPFWSQSNLYHPPFFSPDLDAIYFVLGPNQKEWPRI